MEALIDGQRRPATLADLAKGTMSPKLSDLQRALEGRFDDHHALMCRPNLDHIDHLEQMICRLEEQAEDMMQPFRAERELWTTIPGIGPGGSVAITFRIRRGGRRLIPDRRPFRLLDRPVPGPP
ncbi:hypothetical protein [Rhodococcus sp. PSBB049]|uniref:hypothetical protein n=1 Tax=Rhodococcus sp. PSBB049 TaxID=2812863 RepID=UPI001981C43A|nr:hypothetical protein [Rhodococcus sp. PSBB049]QSE72452.1 hypothetical protein JYA91_29425 [Rhodococcus sp. PSBB049]